PERIGRYRILSVLGEGGMGVVYLAEQDHPKRQVALKVLRSILPTDQARRRFDFEAQVLGRLQHPGIVQVYDAGVTEPQHGGQPFFVLERVTGKPLTHYAAEQRLDARQRLALLAEVCDAVQHAHERGVIHRDLKPANILVDEAGRPKVLDFGIARAVHRDVQGAGPQTDAGQIVGTIPYMSPEQLSKTADALDTRSDIYALGVIGYELLSGRAPYDVQGKPLAEAIRTVAESRIEPLGSHDRALRGDVETVIAKALEREPDRRYASAAELAGDIRRFLADEPIVARPPSAAYHFRKFARRNTAAVAAVGALFAVILVAAPVATWQAIRARSAERLARERLAQAERSAAIERAVNAFLNDDLLAAANPSRLGRGVTVAEVLDRAAEKIGDRFEAEPVVEAAVRYTLGNTYAALGDYEKARPHLERSLALRTEALGMAHPETASAMNSLAGVHWKLGRIEQGAQMWTRSIELQREALGPDAPAVLDSLSNLAIAYRSQGRYAQAAELLEDTIQRRGRTQGEEHPKRLLDRSHFGSTLMSMGRMEQAEPVLESTLAAQRRVLHDDHPDTLRTANALGLLYKQLRRADEAESLLADTLERQRRVLGDRHDDTLATMNNLAILYDDQRRYD
ncbi:MAG: serine/threonine protein kinase, partial [Planctomycetota bacterium]